MGTLFQSWQLIFSGFCGEIIPAPYTFAVATEALPKVTKLWSIEALKLSGEKSYINKSFYHFPESMLTNPSFLLFWSYSLC